MRFQKSFHAVVGPIVGAGKNRAEPAEPGKGAKSRAGGTGQGVSCLISKMNSRTG